MKHRVAGRKLGRTSAHRLALLRNLSLQLFDKERVRTTLMKAKELRPFAEKLVTLSKRETLHARRQVLRHIHDRQVVAKLFDTLSARYAQRNGGYTRILKLGPRRGDFAEMAIVELVGSELGASTEGGPTAEQTKAKAAKKAEAKVAKAKTGAAGGKTPKERPTRGGGRKGAGDTGADRAATKSKDAKKKAAAGAVPSRTATKAKKEG